MVTTNQLGPARWKTKSVWNWKSHPPGVSFKRGRINNPPPVNIQGFINLGSFIGIPDSPRAEGAPFEAAGRELRTGEMPSRTPGTVNAYSPENLKAAGRVPHLVVSIWIVPFGFCSFPIPG